MESASTVDASTCEKDKGKNKKFNEIKIIILYGSKYIEFISTRYR